MHILEPRQTAQCGPVAPCNCGPNEECHQIGRTTTTCASFTCVPKATNVPVHSGGVSTGALAGAIVVALVFLSAAVCLFLWYRKNQRLQRAVQRTAFEAKPDIPASAATVLRRPDPIEKPANPTEFNTVRRYSTRNINLDQQIQPTVARPPSAASNPFTDSHSIQTAGTEGTNVIPIALVSPDPDAQATSLSRSSSANGPSRPVRSPDLNLNLEHANVSEDSVPNAQLKYAASQISGITNRTSYMSSASYGSEFLNEAPMIITPTQGTFRQVLGVVKAEVISAPAPSESLRIPSTASKRPSVSSPLAGVSYGPSDVAQDSGDEQEDADPFSDKHTSTATNLASPSASVTTFGQVSVASPSTPRGDWHADSPTLPWILRDEQSRPSSMSTQAGSVIGIENATRVNLGLSQLSSEAPDTAVTPRSPYRTTMGRLVTPESAGLGVLQEQQRKALAHAQARAQEQGLNRRVSNSSVLSTSTKADSILESFPFVPPSPISNRPVRSPPVSPLGQQTFSVTPASPLPSPGLGESFKKNGDELDLPKPPSRHTLGLSTASQFSTASNGLGSFPFQIDSGAPTEPSSQFPIRQRASLDTLALTNDLSSYPLGVERDSGVLPYQE